MYAHFNVPIIITWLTLALLLGFETRLATLLLFSGLSHIVIQCWHPFTPWPLFPFKFLKTHDILALAACMHISLFL